MQGKRRSPATLRLIRQISLKLQLTLWFYCGKRLLGGTDSLASRANRHVLLKCTLLCVSAGLCSGSTTPVAAEGQSTSRLGSPSFPVASDARLGGDDKKTRFILDLDTTIRFRAFTLADPYRLVVDVPQLNFQLRPGVGTSGRGLVKAFRYGLVMPGGSRIVFDRPGQNLKLLRAGSGERPAGATGA